MPLGQGSGSAPAPSGPPYDAFNLGDHVGDDACAVGAHRHALAQAIGALPLWLAQVHGNTVLQATRAAAEASLTSPSPADGSWTTEPGVACTVMVADCLPLLLTAPEGRGVAALHAGWRGLCGAGQQMAGRGIIETGIEALCRAAHCEPGALQVWLGPCIGPQAFEVGQDVLMEFGVDPRHPHPRFVARPSTPGHEGTAKWFADLAGLAMDRLRLAGVRHVTGGAWCTVSDASRFFSFRRDGVTGRQAACIWLQP